ncbi:MAG: DNA translocase FtsK 4TM domain-containing protein [Desulfobacterales bacterium]|nr:DNA translocase FtsK 4TM domain-containing protein [Desulfobacterales bacterium]
MKSMRNEILGIFLFFLVIFTLISLVTYSPADPSVHHVGTSGSVHNFFGLMGAHIAGIFVGLFGVGAFWIPVLLMLACIEFFKERSAQALLLIAGGGLILTVVTGSLFAIYGESYEIFGSRYAAGGMIGHPVRTMLLAYSNATGATVILAVFFIIGFILTTGVSFLGVLRNFGRMVGMAFTRIQGIFANFRQWRKERQKEKKARKKPKKAAPEKNPPKKKKPPQKAPAEDITIKEAPWSREKKSPVPAPKPRQQVFESMRFSSGFHLPALEFLKDSEIVADSVDHEHLREMSHLLEQKLDDFGVKGKVVTVAPGPVITRFEFEPAPGIKINKVVNLSDDLALALKAMSIRIIAPIPGKAAIGIEVPNKQREVVTIKDIITSSEYEKSKSFLTLGLGKDIVGSPVVSDLQTMPHLLIAGATGTGKSVALNTMICSLLYKATPEDAKFIMIDPKRIELSAYNDIPHLITPVVTDMKKATNALFWAVKEMERRYQLLSENKVRNINQYNRKVQKSASEPAEPDAPVLEKLPYVVLIIDELADLMMVSSRDVEVALTRLAQMARAAGIHLILATQRPSVDVLTGVIKANFPTRLSFQVSSKTDSRTIIDANGAETLLGNGDMLFLPPGTAKLQRIHGAFITEEEVSSIIEFLKTQKSPDYNEEVLEKQTSEKNGAEDKDYDERYDEAVALVARTGQASISMVQRHLRVGYNRAARIIEVMEEEGVVGPSDGVKPREVLARNYEEMS